MMSTHYALRASLIASGIYITDVIGEIKKKNLALFSQPIITYIHYFHPMSAAHSFIAQCEKPFFTLFQIMKKYKASIIEVR